MAAVVLCRVVLHDGMERPCDAERREVDVIQWGTSFIWHDERHRHAVSVSWYSWLVLLASHEPFLAAAATPRSIPARYSSPLKCVCFLVSCGSNRYPAATGANHTHGLSDATARGGWVIDIDIDALMINLNSISISNSLFLSFDSTQSSRVKKTKPT
jgi:hypothetical protein